jgi:chromosome segregation ATPase
MNKEIGEIKEHLDVVCSTTLEVTFRIDLEKCLSHISTLEENIKETLKLAETYKTGWEAAEKKVRELERALTYANETSEMIGKGYREAESRLKRLQEAVDLVIDFIPDGFDVPLGFNQVMTQLKEARNKENGKV